MAVAVYTSDLTTLIPDDTTTTSNWAALGGGSSGLNIETDYFIQGSSCTSKNAFADATKGMVEDTTNTSLSSGTLDAVYTWITHTTPGSLDSKANGGIRIAMGSASNAYNEYYYAGNDTIDYGAPWICAVVDPENATADTGTVLPANMDTYGGLAKLVGGPTKGAPFGIDAIRQGRDYDITAGDGTTPATFTGAAAKNDLTANRYGMFQGVPGISGSYTMQCRLGIGTATTAAHFVDSNASISLNDLEFVDPDFTEFEVVNSGTVVDWTNILIAAVGTNAKGNFLVTSSSSVDLNTCTFTDMGTFTFDSNTTSDGSTYRRCGLVTQNSASIINNVFDSSAATSALLVNVLGSVTDNTFKSDGTGHGVNLGTIAASTSLNWDNQESGYTAASSGNETILVNYTDTGADLTINVVAGASTPSVYNTGAGTVTVVAGQVTTKIIVKHSDGTLLTTQDANVLVEAAAGGSLTIGTDIIKGLTDASGEIEDIRSFATNQPIVGRVRKGTATPYYKTFNFTGTIDTASGFTQTCTMIDDE